MRKISVIQKAVAVLLLVVFTISTTPGHLFHDALTSHTDQPVCQDLDQSTPHFHNPTYHCSFDELVVTTPYLGVADQPVIGHPAFAVSYTVHFPSSPLATTFRHTESRGPPLI